MIFKGPTTIPENIIQKNLKIKGNKEREFLFFGDTAV